MTEEIWKGFTIVNALDEGIESLEYIEEYAQYKGGLSQEEKDLIVEFKKFIIEKVTKQVDRILEI